MKLRIYIKRIIIYFVLMYAAFVLQTTVFPMFGFLYAAPNLAVILTCSYGFIYGSTTGMICGIMAGLLMDLFYTVPFGFFMLVFTYIGFFCGMFFLNFRNDSLLLPAALTFACDIFYNAAVIFLKYITLGSVHLSYSLANIVFPELFFTLITSLLIYQLLLEANRKLDNIDKLRGQNVA